MEKKMEHKMEHNMEPGVKGLGSYPMRFACLFRDSQFGG